MKPYPLLLKPPIKDYLWGGTRLITDFGFETTSAKAAEAWVLSCHKDGASLIANGELAGHTLPEALDQWGDAAVGDKAAAFPYFPILIKLIDARDRLSVQVHPDDAYAMRVEGEFGKTEMWYVVDCEPGAALLYGFSRGLTQEEFRRRIETDTLEEVCNRVPVKKGDVFFIEAGTVHAIGKGALIAEIQQNSNCTYRVYDYGRVGKDGKPRELHIDKAVDVSNTIPPKYDIKPMGDEIESNGNISQLLTKCDLFTVDRYQITSDITLTADADSFNHILVTDGNGEIDGKPAKKGDSYFVPAGYGDYTVKGDIEIIVTRV